MQLTWLGHASWLVVTLKKQAIYFDPYAGDVSELPKADLILISHSHFDHSDSNKIGQLRKEGTTIITSVENAEKIAGVVGLAEGESKKMGATTITAVPAYNINKFRAPNTPYHPKGFGVGFVVETERRIYHAGDSDYVPEMRELKNIDIALLPIGGTYTMTLEEAVEAVKAIKPQVVIPMHFNTPTLEIPANPNEFKQKVEAATKTKVFIFTPGEKQEI